MKLLADDPALPSRRSVDFDGVGDVQHFAPGSVIFALGDPGGVMFLLEEGEVAISHPADHGERIVSQLGPGNLVGEVTAIVGGRRTATVTAVGEVTARALSPAHFASWAQQNPTEAARLAAQARTRIDNMRVARVLTEIVGEDAPELIDAVSQVVEWRTLDAGAVLFHQGEQPDAVYIVVAGRLQITAREPSGDVTLDVEVARGSVVGELGIIENQPRSATVVARRESTLAMVSRAAFEELAERHPAQMLTLFRSIVARVLGAAGRTSNAAGTTAVVMVSESPPHDFVDQWATEVEKFGSAIHLNRDLVHQHLRPGGGGSSPINTLGQAQVAEFLHEAEVLHQYVLLTTDATLSDWTRRAVSGADRVILVISAYPDREERKRIAAMLELLGEVPDGSLWAVRLHAENISRPAGTAELMRQYRFHRVLHVQRGDDNSIRRAARLATGNGIGVALAGGGARGFAHLGALQALGELGVTVDAVTGTSMGSLLGGLVAMGHRPEAVLEKLEAFENLRLMDYTLPVVSLVRGERVADVLDHAFGAVHLEDLWLPFRCISTSITHARGHVHQSGELRRAVRASMSLPGIFPPVVDPEAGLLVDGGVLENLPVSPLVDDPAIGTVIGIETAHAVEPPTGATDEAVVSGLRALRTRRSNAEESFPGLASTVLGSMLVGSSMARNNALEKGHMDLYLTIDLDNVGLLDFSSVRTTIAKGYREAQPQIHAWLATRPE